MSDLEDYQKDIANKRRILAQARAYLQRATNAGIPEKYQRIKQEQFEPLLSKQYHSNTKEFADSIYKNPKILFEKPFIIIDGGDNYSRKTAGFAILFRMITCDRYGKYYDTYQLSSEFQLIKYGKENRNDLVNDVKKEDILFLNEFHPKKFHASFESNLFFDQLLEFRDDYSKPTIITFSQPLEKGFSNQGNSLKDDRCGNYLAMLSQSDMKDNKNVFRIKLK